MMKLTWKNQTKNKNNKRPITTISDLPFDQEEDTTATVSASNTNEERSEAVEDGIVGTSTPASNDDETIKLAESYQAQGNKLAEVGKYREALGKWEAAITLMPERATLHEQKAQVLLEIGETWKSVMAATLEAMAFTVRSAIIVDTCFFFAGITVAALYIDDCPPPAMFEPWFGCWLSAIGTLLSLILCLTLNMPVVIQILFAIKD